VLRRIATVRRPGPQRGRRCVLRRSRAAAPRLRHFMRTQPLRAVVRIRGPQRTLSRGNPRKIRTRGRCDARAIARCAGASRERGPAIASLLREPRLTCQASERFENSGMISPSRGSVSHAESDLPPPRVCRGYRGYRGYDGASDSGFVALVGSESRRSIAATSAGSSGSVSDSKRATTFPFRSTRYF
jgi:hypothetical protein